MEDTGTNGCKRDEVNWKQEEANLKQQDDQTDRQFVLTFLSAAVLLGFLGAGEDYCKQEEGFKDCVLLLFVFTVAVKRILSLNVKTPFSHVRTALCFLKLCSSVELQKFTLNV